MIALAVAAFLWPVPGHVGPRLEPVPILMYHVVAAPPAGAPYPELYVSPRDFRAQMAFLAGRGYTAVTLDEVWLHWRLGWPLPPRPVVLSFDDGYRADYVAVRPVLRAHRWPGVLNLEVRNLEPAWGVHPWEVRALIRDGWEIDAHTVTHPDLTTLDPARLREEVQGSRSDIQKEFHVPVEFFCYPSGRFDATVIAAVRAAGFVGATTTAFGLATPARPYQLARVRVNGSDGVAGLAAKLAALERS